MWICAFCIAHVTIVRACKCLRVCACVCAVGQRCPVEVYNYIFVTPFLLNLPNNEGGVEVGEKGDSEDRPSCTTTTRLDEKLKARL